MILKLHSADNGSQSNTNFISPKKKKPKIIIRVNPEDRFDSNNEEGEQGDRSGDFLEEQFYYVLQNKGDAPLLSQNDFSFINIYFEEAVSFYNICINFEEAISF